jgi:hypothetical protein
MPRPDPGLMKGWPPIFTSAYLPRASLAICAPRWSACPERSPSHQYGCLLPGDAVAGLTMIISMNNGLRRYQPWWATADQDRWQHSGRTA